MNMTFASERLAQEHIDHWKLWERDHKLHKWNKKSEVYSNTYTMEFDTHASFKENIFSFLTSCYIYTFDILNFITFAKIYFLYDEWKRKVWLRLQGERYERRIIIILNFFKVDYRHTLLIILGIWIKDLKWLPSIFLKGIKNMTVDLIMKQSWCMHNSIRVIVVMRWICILHVWEMLRGLISP